MKILFFFPPTGTTGDIYSSLIEKGASAWPPDSMMGSKEDDDQKLSFTENTLRIYFRGCQHSNIGNGIIFPNLDIAAEHIYNSFDGKKLNLEKLKSLMGDAICSIYHDNGIGNTVEAESIGLHGHSRGAVSIFAVAKKLDSLSVPIDIVANQPVTGEGNQSRTLTQKYSDLSLCQNIRSATVMLATHSNYYAWWHNNYFKQLLPKFSTKTITNHFLLPVHQHFARDACSITGLHTNRLFAKYGYTKFDDLSMQNLKEYYLGADKNSWWKSSFIPSIERQQIYGDKAFVAKDPVYLELQHQRALQYLKDVGITPIISIEAEQASAIDYLFKTYSAQKPPTEYINLALEISPKGQQFLQIVNTVTEICNYVAVLNVDKHLSFEKANLIKQAALIYQRSVFKLSFYYLQEAKPTNAQKIQFQKSIYDAEKLFRKDALSMEMGLGRRFMKFLTNFILHITGVGMVVNAIHKAKTGNWLLFNHNRSTTIVRNMQKKLLSEIDTASQENSVIKPVK